MTITTLDPRASSARSSEPGHRLDHVLDELRSSDEIAVSLCGRRAAWIERGGSAHTLNGDADCVVCLDLDGQP